MTFATVRGAVSAAVTGILVLLLLLAIIFAMLGDAGPDWNDPSRRITVVLALLIVGCLAAATGGAIGAWQAAVGGAETVRSAVLAGAAGPTIGVLLMTLLHSYSSFGSVAAAFGELLLFAGAALGGAVLVGRRLE